MTQVSHSQLSLSTNKQHQTDQAYTVYILLCTNGTFYTGIARDVLKRFKEHQAGTASKYTRARGVEKIVYTERAQTRSAALIREAAIKRLSKVQKRQLIASARGDNSLE